MPDQKQILVENAKITFKNFEGREGQFNSPGDRNFHLLLEPALAKQMKADGWRVKQLKPRGEDEEGDFAIKVIVNYKKGRPPQCVLVTNQGKNRTELGPDEVGMLDLVDIKNLDLIINGWYSENYGGGYSAYLKTLFMTVNEDELQLKYADMEPSELGSIMDDDAIVGGVDLSKFDKHPEEVG